MATELPQETGAELGVLDLPEVPGKTFRLSNLSGRQIWAEVYKKSSWNRRFPVTGRQLGEHPLDGWNCQCVLFTWHVMSGVIVPMSGGSLVKSCQRYRLPALSVEKDSPVHLCVSRCTSGQRKNLINIWDSFRFTRPESEPQLSVND